MDHADFIRLATIFVPHLVQRRVALGQANGRLVHYTSARNALSMLTKREIWLRNSQTMNDAMEVQHGVGMMRRYFAPPEQQPDLGIVAFRQAMESVAPGVLTATIQNFNAWMPTIGARTFVTCLSEHDDSEDMTGRLSMWRGYGAVSAPVALVINTTAFQAATNELGAFSNPVSYWNADRYFAEMNLIPARIAAEADFIKGVETFQLEHIVLQMLVATAVSVKHPGFAEEREWRVLHIEGLHDIGKLVRGIEIIGEAPQVLFKLPLRNVPEIPLNGIDPAELVNRVIIGPTKFPLAVAEAMAEALTDAGVPDAWSKIAISEIPLRT